LFDTWENHLNRLSLENSNFRIGWVTAWEHHVPLAFHSGCEADHSPLSSAEVKEWVELYLHSPNTPSWRGAQLGWAQGCRGNCKSDCHFHLEATHGGALYHSSLYHHCRGYSVRGSCPGCKCNHIYLSLHFSTRIKVFFLCLLWRLRFN
jgi:hypothetical protein